MSIHCVLYNTVKLHLPFKVSFSITKWHCNLTNLTVVFGCFQIAQGHEFSKLEVIGGVRLPSNSECSFYCVIRPVDEKTVCPPAVLVPEAAMCTPCCVRSAATGLSTTKTIQA